MGDRVAGARERTQAGDEAIQLYRRRQMLSEPLVPRRL